MTHVVQLVAGLVFGAGLALAGMTSPGKVLAFLDVTGAWDPSLLLVLASAVITAGIGFHWAERRSSPLLAENFPSRGDGRLDRRLVVGSILFGVGWGAAGYCPGPGIALLATPSNPESWLFLSGLTAGYLLERLLRRLTTTP